MMHRRVAVCSLIVALWVGASACTSTEEKSSAPETSNVLTAPASPTQGAPAPETESPATVTASPDATQTQDLVTALNAIAPGVAGDEKQTVERASEVCLDISQGKDDTSLSSSAGERFSTETIMLTDEQATQIVRAVRDTFCHG